MDPVVIAVATALVSAMATDTWQQARATVAALWQRRRPAQAKTINRELDTLRQRVLAAHQHRRTETTQALTAVWQHRLQELIREDPILASELRRILDETLMPMLSPAEQARIGQITVVGGIHAHTFTHITGDHNQITQIINQPAPVKVARTLRADIATFTGRAEQIHEITQTIITGTVRIYAIDGLPGVGKTALAVHVGHQLAGQFGDGQLFVDLHAHSADHAPANPSDTLASLLAATGMPTNQIPCGPADRAACWRDRVAGRRLLLILDNAASSEQVAPLLPGSDDCLILVTSRRRLAGLRRNFGAVLLPLGVLSEPDALALFTRIYPRPLAPGDQVAVVGLVRLCGYLPLAITIVAAGVDPDEDTSVVELLADLETTQDRLAGIDAHLDNEELGVAAAFDLSFQRLPRDQQRVLRLLSLTPGVDIDPYAAAALTDLSLDATRRHLHALHTYRLIDHPTRHRYRLHDLINAYARTHTTENEHHPALDRLLDYYHHAASSANAHLPRGLLHCLIRRSAYSVYSPRTLRPTPLTVAPNPPDRADAIAWLRTESPNLLACLHYARHHGQHARLIGFTFPLAMLLRLDGPWGQIVDLYTYVLAAFEEIGDREGEAWVVVGLCALSRCTGNYHQATTLAERALNLFRQIGDQEGEAWSLSQLGVVQRYTGNYHQATTALEQALTLFRQIGDQEGEVWPLADLGAVWRCTGDYARAATALEQALTLVREIGHRSGEVEVLNHQGALLLSSGDLQRAWERYRQALELARRMGEPLEEARALAGAGRCAVIMGIEGGAEDLRHGWEILHRIGAIEAVELANEIDNLSPPRP